MLKRQQSLEYGDWLLGGVEMWRLQKQWRRKRLAGVRVRAANPNILMTLCSSECPSGVHLQKPSI